MEEEELWSLDLESTIFLLDWSRLVLATPYGCRRSVGIFKCSESRGAAVAAVLTCSTGGELSANWENWSASGESWQKRDGHGRGDEGLWVMGKIGLGDT